MGKLDTAYVTPTGIWKNATMDPSCPRSAVAVATLHYPDLPPINLASMAPVTLEVYLLP